VAEGEAEEAEITIQELVEEELVDTIIILRLQFLLVVIPLPLVPGEPGLQTIH
jgi:hypothetical protein